MLSSATLSTTSLERIKISLGIDREEVLVLSSSWDRPNIFQQSRRLKRRLDIWNIDRDCAWIFPLLADQRAKLKMQIFVLKKDTADIITAWAQRRAERLAIPNLTPSHIEKLSGDNSREEKDRVMMALRAGGCRLLISTKCAGMGCDVQISKSLFVSSSQKTLGSCHKCWDEEEETATTLPSLSCSGRVRPVVAASARSWEESF